MSINNNPKKNPDTSSMNDTKPIKAVLLDSQLLDDSYTGDGIDSKNFAGELTEPLTLSKPPISQHQLESVSPLQGEIIDDTVKTTPLSTPNVAIHHPTSGIDTAPIDSTPISTITIDKADLTATTSVINQQTWVFSVQWQRTNVPKSGLLNKLKKRTQLMDMDLSCLLCNRYGEVIERVWFKNVRDSSEAIRHQGDELMGTKPALPSNVTDHLTADTAEYADGHDPKMHEERISIYLSKLPAGIYHVVFLLTSYTGDAFAKLIGGHCQLADDEGNVISQINIGNLADDKAGLWVGTLTRAPQAFDGWLYQEKNQAFAEYQLTHIEPIVSQSLVRIAS